MHCLAFNINMALYIGSGCKVFECGSQVQSWIAVRARHRSAQPSLRVRGQCCARNMLVPSPSLQPPSVRRVQVAKISPSLGPPSTRYDSISMPTVQRVASWRASASRVTIHGESAQPRSSRSRHNPARGVARLNLSFLPYCIAAQRGKISSRPVHASRSLLSNSPPSRPSLFCSVTT